MEPAGQPSPLTGGASRAGGDGDAGAALPGGRNLSISSACCTYAGWSVHTNGLQDMRLGLSRLDEL
jgi:hypothetical protein